MVVSGVIDKLLKDDGKPGVVQRKSGDGSKVWGELGFERDMDGEGSVVTKGSASRRARILSWRRSQEGEAT